MKAIIRQTSQDAQCRLCDGTIWRKRTEVVYWRTSINGRSANIFLCKPCVRSLASLVEEHDCV